METMSWIEWLKQLMPTKGERTRQMKAVQLVTLALEKYNEGELMECKELLLRVTRRLPITDQNIEECMTKVMTSATIAAEARIDLAIEMIKEELRGDKHPTFPVGLALRTAISLLK